MRVLGAFGVLTMTGGYMSEEEREVYYIALIMAFGNVGEGANVY